MNEQRPRRSRKRLGKFPAEDEATVMAGLVPVYPRGSAARIAKRREYGFVKVVFCQ